MVADERVRAINRVTIKGSIINVVLLIFKFVAGIVGGSAAMIADAVHSLSDFLTDVVVVGRKKVVRHFVTRFEELGSAAPTVDDGHVLARLLSAVNGDEASALAGCARVDAFLDKAAP